MYDKKSFHLEHHSRNMGLLTDDEQRKIDDTSLLIAGCGVGSQIALSAARMGFEKFVIVDGDVVELSNINRQAYTPKDVGKNKVDALALKIKQINPHAQVKKCPIFVDTKNAARLVHKADIVIDSIDPDAGLAILAMHRAARKEHKHVIQPTDAGWGAMVQIFAPGTISFEEMIGLDPKTHIDNVNNEQVFGNTVQFYMKVMPAYVQEIAMEVAEGKRQHYPQPITAAYILAAMVVIAAKRIALGLPVKVAPELVTFDPNVMFNPNEK